MTVIANKTFRNEILSKMYSRVVSVHSNRNITIQFCRLHPLLEQTIQFQPSIFTVEIFVFHSWNLFLGSRYKPQPNPYWHRHRPPFVESVLMVQVFAQLSVVESISTDHRQDGQVLPQLSLISQDWYRPSFVESVLMVQVFAQFVFTHWKISTEVVV